MKLSVDNLKHGDNELFSAENIVEVAIRHGFDSTLEKEFLNWARKQISDNIDYRLWEESMGEDL